MIKRAEYFDYHESEQEPDMDGPKFWLRPSDRAHFVLTGNRWMQYAPINLEMTLKVGETAIISVPKV